jgi:site-specific recombinase XerD
LTVGSCECRQAATGHEATIAAASKLTGPAATGAREITEPTRETVEAWIAEAGLTPEDPLFPSRVRGSAHLSTRQYARIVDSWVNQLGLDAASYGTHTLRWAKATLIYHRTKNLRAVHLLLGHTKLESTVRYLGIEVNDALEMAEQTEV